jgi:glycosyltransferase involved in cell wall biosynthesis
MQLSVIIPTKDRGSVFDQTLKCALKAVEHLDAEILVVNDSRETRPLIPKSPIVRMIDNPRKGVAAARNAGVRSTSGDLILFLDDDIVISRESIDHVVNVHRDIGNICLNVNWEYPPEAIEKMSKTQFGRFMIFHQMTSFKGWYNDASWKEHAIFNSKSVASFHLSMQRKDFEKTSGYNEQFPHAGFEDYDFPLSLKKAGLSFQIDTRVKVYHNEADRMNPQNWLASQERRATTRKVAVGLGYKELELQYSNFKRFMFFLIHEGRWAIDAATYLTPNVPVFDPLFFRLMASLQAYRIYRGYIRHNA